jgi:hypothetical protein
MERFADDIAGIVVQAGSTLALTRDSSLGVSEICIMASQGERFHKEC